MHFTRFHKLKKCWIIWFFFFINHFFFKTTLFIASHPYYSNLLNPLFSLSPRHLNSFNIKFHLNARPLKGSSQTHFFTKPKSLILCPKEPNFFTLSFTPMLDHSRDRRKNHFLKNQIFFTPSYTPMLDPSRGSHKNHFFSLVSPQC